MIHSKFGSARGFFNDKLLEPITAASSMRRLEVSTNVRKVYIIGDALKLPARTA
jgi:hypothetical protein